MQTRLDSFKEVITSTFVGMLGSLVITYAVNRFLAATLLPFWTSLTTVTLCTVWSLSRSYYIRRHFNRKLKVELE